MSYKAVIFDFFGVFCPDISMRWLVGTVPRYKELLPEFHAICGRSDLGELTFEGFCQALSDLTGVPPQAVQQGITAQISMDEQVIALVRQLRRHYRLGLISNATSELVAPLLVKYHLRELFTAVVLSAEVGMVKPEPGIFTYTLQALEVPPSQAVFIDDRPLNAQAAHQLGIESITFTTSQSLQQRLQELGIVDV